MSIRWARAGWPLAAVVTAAAVVVRFVAPSPLWLDEALSTNIAALSAADVIAALRHDGHPPLYYLLLGVWMDIVGTSDAGARALSGIFSLGAAVTVWGATRCRLGPRVARFALVLALTSPFLVRYGAEARMYALVALITGSGWWLVEASLRNPRLGRLIALGVVAASALYTHYWMIFVVLATLVVVNYPSFARRRNTGHTSIFGGSGTSSRTTPSLARSPSRNPADLLTRAEIVASRRVSVAIVLGAASFVFWLPVFVSQATHTGTPWSKRARPAEVVVESLQALGGGRRFEPVFVGVILAVAIVVGATLWRTGHGSVSLRWPPRRRVAPIVAVVVLTLGVGGAAATVSGTAFEARYTAVVVPMLLAIAAGGIAALGRHTAPLVLGVIALFSLAVAIDEARRDRTQGSEVAAAITAAMASENTMEDTGSGSAGEVIVFCPDQLAPAVLRYLNEPVTVLTLPSTANPELMDWYDYTERIEASDPADIAAAALEAAGSRRIWLVGASGYRGFESNCGQIAVALAAERTSRGVVPARQVTEHMTLRSYDAGA